MSQADTTPTAPAARVYPEVTITREDYGYAVSFDGQCVGTADIACTGGGLELLADENLDAAVAAAAADPCIVCDERMLRAEIADLIDAH